MERGSWTAVCRDAVRSGWHLVQDLRNCDEQQNKRGKSLLIFAEDSYAKIARWMFGAGQNASSMFEVIDVKGVWCVLPVRCVSEAGGLVRRVVE